MAYALNQKIWQTAFEAGQLNHSRKPVDFEVVEIGGLYLPSGRVAASDPLVTPCPSPFKQAVPSGTYPVSLAIARFENGDERIAFAQLKFKESLPVRWEMAVVDGQDAGSLAEDEYFGYGVDAGTGSFMDPVAGKLLEERMDEEDEYYNTIIDGMETTYKHTRSWLSFRPSSERSENIVCFSSGWGDGMYPSFFGYSAEGEAVALVTDFLTVSEEEEQPKLAANRKPWWKIW